MDIIVTIEMIQRKARTDYANGVAECPFPPSSSAAKTWREEVAKLSAKEVSA